MKAAQNQIPYEVIISGAGPVGLFLACELALAHCSVLVLEKADDPHSPLKQLPFGIRGLSAPTIEALCRRGMLDELTIHKRLKNPHLTAIKDGPRRQVGHFAGIPFLEGNVDQSEWKFRLPGSPDISIMSEMQELETIFTRCATALGAEIMYGKAITGFRQNADNLYVESGDQIFTGKWLVGCDGSRSTVRKLGGFEFAGTEPEFTGYTTMVDIADPEKLRPGRNLMPKGMYLQSQPGYIIMQDFDGGAFHSSDAPITREHVQETLRRISETDVTVTMLHTAATWTDRARQATAYQNGRILLAGDAAHIHSPLGGQGLNLGLGDAMNLGWKLAAKIHGHAPEGLLDTYFTERYPIGAQVLDWSRAQVAIMKPEPQARALNAIFRDLLATRDGATYIAGRVWGIHTQYDLGGRHPLTGRSVPDFKFENGTKMGDFLRESRGVLVDFNSNADLQSWVENQQGKVKYVTGKAKDQLGLNALLIRPDGIVAWATDIEINVPELDSAASRWF